MIYLISKKDALSKIRSEYKEGECLACNVLASKYTLDKGVFSTTVLSMYPRFWGQIMVVLNSHKISVSQLSKEEWCELNENIYYATKALEKTLNPVRCYISCLGSVQNLPNTCPHLHFNIIPIYSETIKPSEVYTWENGLYNGHETEWNELYNSLLHNFEKR